MSDFEKDQREQSAQIRRDAELMEQLIAHPGWPAYRRIVEAAGNNFFAQLMTPLTSVDDCVRAEYAKGALYGLQASVDLPMRKIEESRTLRNPSNEEGTDE